MPRMPTPDANKYIRDVSAAYWDRLDPAFQRAIGIAAVMHGIGAIAMLNGVSTDKRSASLMREGSKGVADAVNDAIVYDPIVSLEMVARFEGQAEVSGRA